MPPKYGRDWRRRNNRYSVAVLLTPPVSSSIQGDTKVSVSPFFRAADRPPIAAEKCAGSKFPRMLLVIFHEFSAMNFLRQVQGRPLAS